MQYNKGIGMQYYKVNRYAILQSVYACNITKGIGMQYNKLNRCAILQSE